MLEPGKVSDEELLYWRGRYFALRSVATLRFPVRFSQYCVQVVCKCKDAGSRPVPRSVADSQRHKLRGGVRACHRVDVWETF